MNDHPSPFIMVINRGELLMQTLTKWAQEKQIHGASLSGVGALLNVEIGYYELEHKQYIRKTFRDMDYELLSLNGNITLKDGSPFIHAHVVLGASDFQVLGGHLFEATVAVTAEISITPLSYTPKRMMSNEIGLALICPHLK